MNPLSLLVASLYKTEKKIEAKSFQRNAMLQLEKAGFDCKSEVKVPDRGDGRGGRLDIVASMKGEIFAIEIDRLTARKKSLYKLKHFDCDARLIFLREPFEVSVLF